MKIRLISLGCARNLVDSEIILGNLKKSGFVLVDESKKTDIIIINTCGFIKDAKMESIDAILEGIELKKRGEIKYLIVAGCLTQRYKDKLKNEFDEVDAFIGINEIERFADIIKRMKSTKKSVYTSKNVNYIYSHKSSRINLTPEHLAYIKISDGCVHKCSYCAIPLIRGPFRSRPKESILKEAKNLLIKGNVSELNIIGQDTTAYGIDIYKKLCLPELLKNISGIKKDFWLRLLYTHPTFVTDELISTIKDNANICKYIDLPLQHINDKILKSMHRGITKLETLKLIDKIRNSIPGVALRTSLIVGYPGETTKEFSELIKFIRSTKFERLGAFIYSNEEGTAAYKLNDQISDVTKEGRLKELMLVQKEISGALNSSFEGKIIPVLIDKVLNEENSYIGRSYMDAPEIDCEIYVKSKRKILPGEFVNVLIQGSMEYDLIGEAV